METGKLKLIETIDFPTTFGKFELTTYETHYDNQPLMHYAFVFTTGTISKNPIVRIHSECMLSEIFHSTHCDCREQLELGMKTIKEENGILFYLNQEGRGHGIINKIKELKKQQEGLDTVQASEFFGYKVDDRDYKVVADILKLMNINEIRLLTNNPKKIQGLEDDGVVVSGRIPAQIKPNSDNINYLKIKKLKLGHMLDQYV